MQFVKKRLTTSIQPDFKTMILKGDVLGNKI